MLTETLDEAFANRGGYQALGVVSYELLPQLNRFEPSFVEAVLPDSEQVPHDVIALADGAAVVHATGDEYRQVGEAARCRDGVMTVIGATA